MGIKKTLVISKKSDCWVDIIVSSNDFVPNNFTEPTMIKCIYAPICHTWKMPYEISMSEYN